MKIVQVEYPYRVGNCDPAVAAIGYFDGIHLGHQGVIRRAIARANERKLTSCVITFDPHPREVLKKEQVHSYITPLPDKLEILKDMGVDLVYVIHFTERFSRISPQTFIEEILYPLQIRGVVVGFDFRFGHGGLGTAELLKELGEDRIEVEVVPPILDAENKISSSLIRAKISAGEMEEVSRYLTRPHRLRGLVIHGAKRGRLLGFPTANMHLSGPYHLPPNGVYGVRVDTGHGTYFGVMNIGVKPTFESQQNISVEIHLLDFHGDLYMVELKAEILFHIRSEQKFHSIEALKAQIHADIQFAKKKFICYT